ncbi:MAG: DUF4157 domain-containing protein [Ruminococcus sp.]|nr:DUF4157 domain-containing protein [Ruminococcus sp.]
MNDLTAQKQSKSNLPAQLKANIEAMSGFSMDDVRVHYNSSKPAQMKALAYTQGTDIHVGPGQEKHLGHEAWHVVQQKQGRVAPTAQLKGVNVNTDSSLEHEADVMGARASVFSAPASPVVQRKPASGAQGTTVQFVTVDELTLTEGRIKNHWNTANPGYKTPISGAHVVNKFKEYLLNKWKGFDSTIKDENDLVVNCKLEKNCEKDNLTEYEYFYPYHPYNYQAYYKTVFEKNDIENMWKRAENVISAIKDKYEKEAANYSSWKGFCRITEPEKDIMWEVYVNQNNEVTSMYPILYKDIEEYK